MSSRYPLSMHKFVEGDGIHSRHVFSAEEEQAHVEQGWSPKVPEIPAAPEVPADDIALQLVSLAAAVGSLTAVVAELEERVARLEAKRGPGRPAKEA